MPSCFHLPAILVLPPATFGRYREEMMLNRALLCLCLIALAACNHDPQGIRVISGEQSLAAPPVAGGPVIPSAPTAPGIQAPALQQAAPAMPSKQTIAAQALCANGLPPPSAQGCVATPTLRAPMPTQPQATGQGIY